MENPYGRLLRAIPIALLRIFVVTLIPETAQHNYDASNMLMQQYDFVISEYSSLFHDLFVCVVLLYCFLAPI